MTDAPFTIVAQTMNIVDSKGTVTITKGTASTSRTPTPAAKGAHKNGAGSAPHAGGSHRLAGEANPQPQQQQQPGAPADTSSATWNPPHLFTDDGVGDGLLPASTRSQARVNLLDLKSILAPMAPSIALVQMVVAKIDAKLAATPEGDQPLTTAEVGELDPIGLAALGTYNNAMQLTKSQLAQSLSEAQMPPGLEEMSDQAADLLHDAFSKDESTVAKAKEASEHVHEAVEKVSNMVKWALKAKGLVAKAEKWEKIVEAVEGFHTMGESALKVWDLINEVATAAVDLSKTNDSSMSNAQQVGAGLDGGIAAAKALIAGAEIFGLETVSQLGGIWAGLVLPQAEEAVKVMVKADQLLQKGNKQIMDQLFAEAVQSGGPAPTLPTLQVTVAKWYPGGQATLDYMWAVWQGKTPDTAPATVTQFFYEQRDKMNADHGASEKLDTSWHLFGANEVKNLKEWVTEHRAEVWAMLYGSLPHPGGGD